MSIFTEKGFHLPPDHKPAMRVPKGGSMCANCEYVKGSKCTNEFYIKWNGSNEIPAPTNSYCSDWYEPTKEKSLSKKIRKYKL